MQLFKRPHHGARGSLSTPLPLFLILVFLFSVCLLSLPRWESMDWSLVPARKRTCERTPAYRGGSFLLQREQHHLLRRVMATYTLSTGVDSRATHGTL